MFELTKVGIAAIRIMKRFYQEISKGHKNFVRIMKSSNCSDSNYEEVLSGDF